MIDSGTQRYANNLDRVRRRRGPQGDLTFLRFTGAHEYEEVLVVTAGWFGEFIKRREQSADKGKPVYFALDVAVLPENDLSALLKEEWRFAIGGTVFTIDKDRLTPPMVSPYHWWIEAFRTDDTYPASE